MTFVGTFMEIFDRWVRQVASACRHDRNEFFRRFGFLAIFVFAWRGCDEEAHAGGVEVVMVLAEIGEDVTDVLVLAEDHEGFVQQMDAACRM